MSKSRIKYICTNCGHESLKWLGKCPVCDEWNSFSEEVVEMKKSSRSVIKDSYSVQLKDFENYEEVRIKTNINEFDRVLGGGLVKGSIVLIGGDPGIGKSTLVLQAASSINAKVLYITGEESLQQINLRAKRLNVSSDKIFVIAETDLDTILSVIEKSTPEVVIIDSVQTVSKSVFDNAPGTVTQIRECTIALMQTAKLKGFSVMLIGHVTKEGYIAGPKVLEHIVDTVLQFEGEKNYSYRILRSQKNRFGSTNEIGIFEMHDSGLSEVNNPSEIFLHDRGENITGSVVAATVEGTRPVLLEVQALVTPSNYGNPQRVVTGFDYRRLSILLAVLEKRMKLRLSAQNVFVNLSGGLKVDEPAIDLAVCSAVASSFWEKSVRKDVVVVGEVGLSGELRTVANTEKRIKESAKLGFRKILMPKGNYKNIIGKDLIELHPVDTLGAALKILFE